MITLSAQNIITAAAVLGALIALMTQYNKAYDLVKHQKEQDKRIASIQEEQAILVYGMLACLKGLKEKGCNGPVTEAINKIENHLNEQAHAQR